jgi:SH3-like domain-containing protein
VKTRWISRWTAAVVVAIALVSFSFGQALAQGQLLGPETNFPLPRFVSLKSGQVNVRVGPGSNYPIDWTYVRFGLPVEIIQEFDNWRQVRDSAGNEGWILSSLLSGDRFAIVLANSVASPLEVRLSPDGAARVVALLEIGVIAVVDRCGDGWCRLVDDRFSGWVDQERLWGVYPDEEF